MSILEQSEPLTEYDLTAIWCIKTQYDKSNSIHVMVEKFLALSVKSCSNWHPYSCKSWCIQKIGPVQKKGCGIRYLPVWTSNRNLHRGNLPIWMSKFECHRAWYVVWMSKCYHHHGNLPVWMSKFVCHRGFISIWTYKWWYYHDVQYIWTYKSFNYHLWPCICTSKWPYHHRIVAVWTKKRLLFSTKPLNFN